MRLIKNIMPEYERVELTNSQYFNIREFINLDELTNEEIDSVPCMVCDLYGTENDICKSCEGNFEKYGQIINKKKLEEYNENY